MVSKGTFHLIVIAYARCMWICFFTLWCDRNQQEESAWWLSKVEDVMLLFDVGLGCILTCYVKLQILSCLKSAAVAFVYHTHGT